MQIRKEKKTKLKRKQRKNLRRRRMTPLRIKLMTNLGTKMTPKNLGIIQQSLPRRKRRSSNQ